VTQVLAHGLIVEVMRAHDPILELAEDDCAIIANDIIDTLLRARRARSIQLAPTHDPS
jgi:hypothetical protein